jgi:hypothetical protein
MTHSITTNHHRFDPNIAIIKLKLAHHPWFWHVPQYFEALKVKAGEKKCSKVCYIYGMNE